MPVAKGRSAGVLRSPCRHARTPLFRMRLLLASVVATCSQLQLAFSAMPMVRARGTLARHGMARAAQGEGAAEVTVKSNRNNSNNNNNKKRQELTALFKSDPVSFYHWRKFLQQKGLGPAASQDEEVVQEFLASAGTFDRFEIASAEVLADFEKAQKEYPAATWLWHTVAAREAFGVANRKAVPAKLLQDFLRAYHAGSLEQLELVGDELAAQLNTFRKTNGGGGKWDDFRDAQFGEGVAPRDPKIWPADLVRRFLAEQSA